MMVPTCIKQTVLIGLTFLTVNVQAQQNDVHLLLQANGSIKAGNDKLDSCIVITYLGNDSVDAQMTSRSGKFKLFLQKDQEYGVVFKRNGYVPKRIIIDTHAKISEEVFAGLTLDMGITLFAEEKFDGVNTDALDFPGAILKYYPKENAFLEDVAYTSGVMRTNGALMLAAGRSGKK